MLLSRAISVVALLACILCGAHAQDSEADLGTLLTTLDSSMVTSQRLLRTSVDLDNNEERVKWPFQNLVTDYLNQKAIRKSLVNQAKKTVNAHDENVLEEAVKKEINAGRVKNVKQALSKLKNGDPAKAKLQRLYNAEILRNLPKTHNSGQVRISRDKVSR
ncbi:hypothetical protein CCR75_006115 [Bremia lactucae]|uniref:RxLR effector protein n=1 Tax=Bremia lactucae TaxID=4779 RepID=A0A976II16_BRELC|nr:hypothetical protein CCR75_006115 [Bremia lactucae]